MVLYPKVMLTWSG